MKKIFFVLTLLSSNFLYAQNCDNLTLKDYVQDKYILIGKVNKLNEVIVEDRKILVTYSIKPNKFYSKKAQHSLSVTFTTDSIEEEGFEYMNLSKFTKNDKLALNEKEKYYFFVDKSENNIYLNDNSCFVINKKDLEKDSTAYRAVNMFGFNQSFSIKKDNTSNFSFGMDNKVDNNDIIKNSKSIEELIKIRNKKEQ
tara:strand:- start:524 stop:1114 length:591 start_codon:yes stop_codon:yes gene_type:complete